MGEFQVFNPFQISPHVIWKTKEIKIKDRIVMNGGGI